MRKITIMGLGALATVSLAFGSASPASAIPLPGSIGDTVCNAVPSGLAGVASQVASNSIQNALLTTNNGLAVADLTVKTTALVTSLVAHVVAIDTNGPVALTSAAVGTAASAYSVAAATWTQSVRDLDANELAGSVLGLQSNVLGLLDTGLLCA